MNPDLSDTTSSRPFLLYDGLCGVCNHAVRWVIQRDHGDHFRFAPQQSAFAETVLRRHGIDREALLTNNSVYLILHPGSDQERLLRESDVTVNILLALGGGWRVLGVLLRAAPSFLRNAAYRLFARNRYRLGRRYTVCPLPTEADRMKFEADL